MRVVVIGASGAVGIRLTRQLTERGHEVTGTCRSASREGTIRSAGATPLALDVLNAAATRTAVAQVRPDAIIYQATALTGMRFGRSLDKTFAAINRLRTDDTSNVIVAARSAGVRKLVAQRSAMCRGWARRVHFRDESRDPRTEGSGQDIGSVASFDQPSPDPHERSAEYGTS
jgi:nucleoside-diphosphate-sugar epimerase